MYILLMALAVSAASCSEPEGTAQTPTATDPPSQVASTTTTEAEVQTTTSTVATTTTAATPSTTTTLEAATPELVAGTFIPSGTVVPTELPEGAIGPAEQIVGDQGSSLTERIGVNSYRIRSIGTTSYGDEPPEQLLVEVEVVEGTEPEETARHEWWYAPTSASGDRELVAEVIVIDGHRYGYDVEDNEWRDIGFPQDIFGLPPPVATTYTVLDEASFALTGSIWLGNEEIDGVSVGHFEVPPIPEEYRGDSDSNSELWIDADGVVWRFVWDYSFNDGEIAQSLDAVLYDVGAKIEIVAPVID